jgi:hypothetical protein
MRSPSHDTESRSANRLHWTTLALKARPRLDGLRFGNRETALQEIAAETSINPQTLRRALAALKFVETLEGERFLKGLSLRNAPVAAIEHLARWHAYDRDAALRAARKLSQGEFTVAALGAAEKAARQAAQPDNVGRGLIQACRLRVGPVLRMQFKDFEMDENAARRSDEPSVEFRFRPVGTTRWTIAAIIMGPYRNERLYETRMSDWIVRALGLRSLYQRVILVVPKAAIRKRCLTWLNANGLVEDAFDIQIIPRKS